MKIFPKDVKEIPENGIYSFRAKAINPYDDGLEVLYSYRYLCRDIEDLNRSRREWEESLKNKGYKNIEVTGITLHPNTKTTSSLSLTELNKEFILDI